MNYTLIDNDYDPIMVATFLDVDTEADLKKRMKIAVSNHLGLNFTDIDIITIGILINFDTFEDVKIMANDKVHQFRLLETRIY